MRLPRRPLPVLALAALLALAISACGDNSPSSKPPTDEAKIRQTVVSWYSALATADGAKLCELVSPAVRRKVAETGTSISDRIIDSDDELDRLPHTCAARATHTAQKNVIDQGVAPAVNNADIKKIDVLGNRANARTQLGRGQQIMALEKVHGRWLVSGFPQ
jgi:hypothetical protein